MIELVGRSFVIFIEFGIGIKLLKLMSLYETCCRVQVGMCLAHFLIRMVWSKEILYCH